MLLEVFISPDRVVFFSGEGSSHNFFEILPRKGKTSSVKQRMISLRCTGGCYYCFSTITETLGLGGTPGHHLASSPFYWVAPSQQLPSLSVPVDGLPAHLPPTASCVPLGMQEEPGAPCAWGSLPL